MFKKKISLPEISDKDWMQAAYLISELYELPGSHHSMFEGLYPTESMQLLGKKLQKHISQNSFETIPKKEKEDLINRFLFLLGCFDRTSWGSKGEATKILQLLVDGKLQTVLDKQVAEEKAKEQELSNVEVFSPTMSTLSKSTPAKQDLPKARQSFSFLFSIIKKFFEKKYGVTLDREQLWSEKGKIEDPQRHFIRQAGVLAQCIIEAIDIKLLQQNLNEAFKRELKIWREKAKEIIDIITPNDIPEVSKSLTREEKDNELLPISQKSSTPARYKSGSEDSLMQDRNAISKIVNNILELLKRLYCPDLSMKEGYAAFFDSKEKQKKPLAELLSDSTLTLLERSCALIYSSDGVFQHRSWYTATASSLLTTIESKVETLFPNIPSQSNGR